MAGSGGRGGRREIEMRGSMLVGRRCRKVKTPFLGNPFVAGRVVVVKKEFGSVVSYVWDVWFNLRDMSMGGHGTCYVCILLVWHDSSLVEKVLCGVWVNVRGGWWKTK